MKCLTILLSFVMLVLASVALAATGKLSIQGHLANGGAPTDGDHVAVFSFHDAPTAGTQLWTETDTIHVQAYVFSATLGKTVPIPEAVFASSAAWLETTVDGTTLTPRIAYYPQPQLTVTGTDNLWSTDGTNAWRQTGRVGIGTASPSNTLEIRGVGPGESGIWIKETDDGGVAAALNANEDRGYLQLLQGNAVKLELNAYPGASQYINNGGNVGINTATPQFPLDVNGNVRMGSRSQNNVALTIDGPNQPENSNSSQDIRFGFEMAGSAGIRSWRGLSWDTYLQFLTNPYNQGSDSPQPRITIDGYGQVGFGLTNPQATIDMVGNLKTRLQPVGNSSGMSFNTASESPSIGFHASDNSQRFTIATNITASNPSDMMRFQTSWVGDALTIQGNGSVNIPYNLTVSGTKCREVVDPTYGKLYFNAVESGTADFTDRGDGQLINGRCSVELNPKWLAGVTIDNAHPMQVTITAYYGPHGGQEYVVRTTTGFTVIDPSGSSASFGWKVEARQKGYEDLYLDRPNSVATK